MIFDMILIYACDMLSGYPTNHLNQWPLVYPKMKTK